MKVFEYYYVWELYKNYMHLHPTATKIQKLIRSWLVRSRVYKCLDIGLDTPLRTLLNSLDRLQFEMKCISSSLLQSLKIFEYNFITKYIVIIRIQSILHGYLTKIQYIHQRQSISKIQSLIRGAIVRKHIDINRKINLLTPPPIINQLMDQLYSEILSTQSDYLQNLKLSKYFYIGKIYSYQNPTIYLNTKNYYTFDQTGFKPSITIQHYARGFLAHKEYQLCISATITL